MRQNLIFIHGFRGNSNGLKAVASCFDPKKYNIYTPDLPPAGGHSLKTYDAASYANFIANFIKKNNLKRPILIGHSMGSIIAAATAEKYPELIDDKIVFLAPISKKPAFFFACLTPLCGILPNKLITYITTRYMFIPKDKDLFKKVLQISNKCGADYTAKHDVFRSGWFSSHAAISDFDIHKDAIFISGENDRLIPKSATEIVARKFHAKTVYVDGTGHLLNYENPSKTAAAILDYIN